MAPRTCSAVTLRGKKPLRGPDEVDAADEEEEAVYWSSGSK